MIQKKQTLVQGFSEKSNPAKMNVQSAEMTQVYSMVEIVSKTQTSVMLRGETGTEKEKIAALIHSASSRSHKPFIKFSFPSLPSQQLEIELFGYEAPFLEESMKARCGIFELANRGTLFLNDVENIPSSLQTKILSLLKDGEFQKPGTGKTIKTDIRFIAATSQILENEVRVGRFKEELYYRLNIVTISIPKLKYCREEIPLFVKSFLESFNKRNNTNIQSISEPALRYLMSNSWLGNFSEMENMLERACTLCFNGTLTLDHFPRLHEKGSVFQKKEGDFQASLALSDVKLPEAVEILEKEMIKQALAKTHGVQSRACEILGITTRMLGYKLTQYHLRESLCELPQLNSRKVKRITKRKRYTSMPALSPSPKTLSN